MWGPAIYFAVNASYSHGYAHADTTTGLRQMFLSEVLIGNYAERPSAKYTKPPIDEATGLDYDSIKGRTGGSDVYMIYTNNKSYPRYLVSYQ
jgi:hypothetical protein